MLWVLDWCEQAVVECLGTLLGILGLRRDSGLRHDEEVKGQLLWVNMGKYGWFFCSSVCGQLNLDIEDGI